MAFETEQEMVHRFIATFADALSSLEPRGLRTLQEVRVPGGIPDFVLFRRISNSVHYVIAIEFKLSRWQRALKQAFRNRNFANESYVVLDRDNSSRALDNISMFYKANVGLFTNDSERELKVHHFHKARVPFSSKYATRIAGELIPDSADVPSEPPFARTARGGVALSDLRQIGTYVGS